MPDAYPVQRSEAARGRPAVGAGLLSRRAGDRHDQFRAHDILRSVTRRPVHNGERVRQRSAHPRPRYSGGSPWRPPAQEVSQLVPRVCLATSTCLQRMPVLLKTVLLWFLLQVL